MVEPQDRNNYCVESLRVFNFDFWFVAPGPVSASRGLSTGTAAATAPSAFAAPKELGGPGGGVQGGGPGSVGACRHDPPSAPPFPAPGCPSTAAPRALQPQGASDGDEMFPGTCDLNWQSQEPQISSGKPLPPSAPQLPFSPAGGWMKEEVSWLFWFLLGPGVFLLGFFARSFSAWQVNELD